MRAVLVILSMWLAVGQGPSVVDQFAGADSPGKRRLVTDVVMGKRPASDDDVRALLAAAMRDPDVLTRVEAVGAITTILTMSSMSPVPASQEWTVRMRPVAESLKPQLDAAVDDPEPRVRLEALRGLLSEVVAAQFGGRGTGVPKDLAIQLSARFDADASPAVRAFVLQALTMSGRSDDAEVRAIARGVLLKGVAATDPAVVQAAAISVSRSPVPEALPPLVAQLTHTSSNVRVAVAQAIAAFHDAARPYLPALQTALKAETDDIARKTLAGSIAVVSR